MRERIGQLKQEIEGLAAQKTANDQQIKLIGQELDGVQDLYRKNLVPLSRLTALQREASRLEGESGALIAQKARERWPDQRDRTADSQPRPGGDDGDAQGSA